MIVAVNHYSGSTACIYIQKILRLAVKLTAKNAIVEYPYLVTFQTNFAKSCFPFLSAPDQTFLPFHIKLCKELSSHTYSPEVELSRAKWKWKRIKTLVGTPFVFDKIATVD